MSERTQVVCGHCDSVVGLPSERLKDAPRCPKCHSPLFEGKPIELTEGNFDKHLGQGRSAAGGGFLGALVRSLYRHGALL